MTFSTPRVARLDLGAAAPTPVLVFAGGYHGGWAGAARVGRTRARAPTPSAIPSTWWTRLMAA